ncbi:MAG: hypothetical protein HY060_09900 [Proteobacteria bacterium]|nr:hypothetical protein [Pseudomonadota bacterium]
MAVDLVLGLADRAYQQGDWVLALAFYRNALAMDPAQSAARGYRLTIGHCEIELAAADALAGLALEADAGSGSERERAIASMLRLRARDLCRAGDGARAARLLRLLVTCDAAIAETYAQSIDAAPTSPAASGDAGGDPAFLVGVRDLDVAALKQRLRAQLAAAGQGWAQRYFTGDYFWAGLLDRVIGHAR